MEAPVLVLSPAPGIGDFVVRIPALRFLAHVFDSVVVLVSLPEPVCDTLQALVNDVRIRIVPLSTRYKKRFVDRFLVRDEFSVACSLRRNRFRFIVLMVDQSTLGGILKLLLMSRIIAWRTSVYAIRPPKLRFFGALNMDIPQRLHKRERFLAFAKAVAREKNGRCLEPTEDIFHTALVAPNPSGILIAPGSKRPSRRWPYHLELMQKLLSAYPIQKITVTGFPDELQPFQSLSNRVSILNAPSASVLLDTVRSTSLLVCNDSGLLHLGVYCRVPTLALCGPEDFAVWNNYEEKHYFPLFKKVVCNPCRLWHCSHQTCLRSISVEEVVAKIESILALRRLSGERDVFAEEDFPQRGNEA